MLERTLFAVALMIMGVVAYHLYTRYHLVKATANASTDPLLQTLKPGVPAVLYFTTPGCIPCRTQQQPTLARLQADWGEGIQVIQIDASEQSDAADRWGVFSAPTTFILDGAQQVHEVNYGVADLPKLKRQLEGAIRERNHTVRQTPSLHRSNGGTVQR